MSLPVDCARASTASLENRDATWHGRRYEQQRAWKEIQQFLPASMRFDLVSVREWLLCSCAFLAAAMGCTFRSHQQLDTGVRDPSSSIVVGQTHREAVHDILGRPRITNRFWRVDVFRHSERQYEMSLLLFIPVSFQTDVLHRYTLVAYDAHDVVEGVSTGVLRENEFPVIDYDHLSLSLRTAQFVFDVAEGDGLEVLMAEPSRWSAYLDLLAAGPRCTIVLGCTGKTFPPYPQLCAVDITFDDGQVVSLPRSRTAVATVSLSPGEHVLTISHRTKHSWTATTPFHCGEGAGLYILAGAQLEEPGRFWADFWHSRRVNWAFDIRRERPESLDGQPLVLFHDRRWLPEPASATSAEDRRTGDRTP